MASARPKHVKRACHARCTAMIAKAALAGMRVQKHKSVSRNWSGASHSIWSMDIEGVTIYRVTRAALARIYLELLA